MLVLLFNIITAPSLIALAVLLLTASAVFYFCHWYPLIGVGLALLFLVGLVLDAILHYLDFPDLKTGLQNGVFVPLTAKINEYAGYLQFLLGIHDHSVASMMYHPMAEIRCLFKLFGDLFHYLVKDEMLPELASTVRIHSAERSKIILGVVQQASLKGERPDGLLLKENGRAKEHFSMGEIQHYIKFAVAGYGDSGIKSSRFQRSGSADLRRRLNANTSITAKRVSEHTGIPPQDLLYLNVSYSSNVEQLRYYIALDRARKAVVLVISGTYSWREILIDANGYARDFMGGGAHSHISIMAERLWKDVGDKVVEILDEYEGYEFVCTGHSLGGGTACLVNLLLHNDEQFQNGRKFRVIAYASPPVLTTDLFIKIKEKNGKWLETCVNVINAYDAVPFMCGDSVRHQLAMIAAIQDAKLSFFLCIKLYLGWEAPDAHLAERIYEIQSTPLPIDKEGCPNMCVPALANFWLWPDGKQHGSTRTYKVLLGDSEKLSKAGIFVERHHRELFDHFPARYEFVLDRVNKQ